MILMEIKLDNIYGFNKFEMNFSYPRKLAKNTIGEECLVGRPNFKYKKAVILMGANASGKTSLGKAMLNIFRYILDGTPERIITMVRDINKPATCVVDYVDTVQTKLVRFKTEVLPSNDESKQPIINNFCSTNLIREKDSYESCREALDQIEMTPIHASDFNILKPYGLGFNFSLSDNMVKSINFSTEDFKIEFLKTVEAVLKTLDPSIDKVYESKELDDSYVIQKGDIQILIQKGVLQDSNNILSSGTKEGIYIASTLAAITLHENGFYYIDEQFSHIQTDLEKKILSIMIQKLGDKEQLILTTHNTDILDMNLPKHSFAFLKRVKNNDGYNIQVEFASGKLKRDADSVRCAAENDVFESLPDESLLDLLISEEDA